jgi:hypothetical protein
MAKRGRKSKKGNNSPTQPQNAAATPPPCPEETGAGGMSKNYERRVIKMATSGFVDRIPDHMMDEVLAFIRMDMHSDNPRYRGNAVKAFLNVTNQALKERLTARHVPTVDQQSEQVERLLSQLDAIDETLPLTEDQHDANGFT